MTDSCDIFVVFPPLTENNCIIIGKNENKAETEVQEVLYLPTVEEDREASGKVKCTYLEIDQVAYRNALILSKPHWSWGGGMGANEHGLVVCQASVKHKLLSDEANDKKLLGFDLVRLALERARTALEAKEVIALLLEKYGQGGPSCSNNVFVMVDRNEGLIMETLDKHWAAKRLQSGFIHTSNTYGIASDYDELSGESLKELAKSTGLWNEDSNFNFSQIFSVSYMNSCEHMQQTKKLLDELAQKGNISVSDMFSLQRNEDNHINRSFKGSVPTMGSQVSVLSSNNSSSPCCHWFTGTPDNRFSVFKPFIFCPNSRISPHIQFKSPTNAEHKLYEFHRKALTLMSSEDKKGKEIHGTLLALEAQCVQEVERLLLQFNPSNVVEVEDLLKDAVEVELKFYM